MFKARWQAIVTDVLSAFGPGLDVVNCQRLITDWWLTAEAATIVPCIFDRFSPTPFGFATCQAFHVCEILMVRGSRQSIMSFDILNLHLPISVAI